MAPTTLSTCEEKSLDDSEEATQSQAHDHSDESSSPSDWTRQKSFSEGSGGRRPSSPDSSRPNVKENNKRQRRGAVMLTPDESLECVMAAMLHSDMLRGDEDDDPLPAPDTCKRRRSHDTAKTPRASFLLSSANSSFARSTPNVFLAPKPSRNTNRCPPLQTTECTTAAKEQFNGKEQPNGKNTDVELDSDTDGDSPQAADEPSMIKFEDKSPFAAASWLRPGVK